MNWPSFQDTAQLPHTRAQLRPRLPIDTPAYEKGDLEARASAIAVGGLASVDE